MSLIKSISGIRGTIGGKAGEGLSPIDIVKFTSAYASFIKSANPGKEKCRIVVGRDARLSGEMVYDLVAGSLIGMGCDVVNIGKATTPTTELAVVGENADGGIIITASHNPKEWNALKLLNAEGEFLNDKEGKKVIEIAEKGEILFSDISEIGNSYINDTWGEKHIEMVANLPQVDIKAIREAKFSVVVDAVNSVGGMVIPSLLKRLGVNNIIELNCEANGKFSHLPEPIPENLTQISEAVVENNADLGIVVDPDVDRLALIMEDGRMFGEENTLVAVSDYVLGLTPGNTVSNLSSSRALRDITIHHGGKYTPAAVGEVNVVAKMKETGAVIGGEGNGGVIYPELHYGRDALVGVALFLTYLAKKKVKMTELHAELPEYYIVKKKLELKKNVDLLSLKPELEAAYPEGEFTDIDGIKIDFEDKWIHMRKSNTEPIIRIYSEAHSVKEAEDIADRVIGYINQII